MPTLIPVNESTETLSLLEELVASIRLGFFPDSTLVEAPYPYPSSTSYPGDTIEIGLTGFVVITEGTETLTPMAEA